MGRVLLMLAALGLAQAHEIGTTRVEVKLNAGHFDVLIATDGGALGEKLAVLTGRAAPSEVAQLEALLAAQTDLFRRRVELAFDGAPAAYTMDMRVEPAADAFSAMGANIRLRGTIPVAARNLTWKFGWTFATYSFSIRRGAAAQQTLWVEGSDTSPEIALAPTAPESRLSIAHRYLTLGFTHIVPLGLDHMLFVLGIYLLSRRANAVLWQVSAFTLAHSITLGLTMAGLIALPARVVEPMIALSIAYVAIENLFINEIRAWRIALVFGFGLLHGMGFAGALAETGLPRSEFFTALASFNVGVEAGQLAVIGAAFLLLGWRMSQRDWYRRRVVVPASFAIACAGLYWTVERLSS